MTKNSDVGKIGWFDLTVDDAERVRDFYQQVVGWKSEGVDMGGYQDYCMLPEEGGPVAGVCHARGTNEGLPPQWLMYITVANLEASLASCRALGGEVVRGARGLGGQGRFAIVRDPAGAVCALFEKA
ncbi:MAG: VOC family protein [Planctomycetes bacterium]|nr:VOC family protein [Planctomycetota bacterium]